MKILITGGTGFIGSRLALRCQTDGHTVRVFGQENTDAESLNRQLLEERGVEVVVGSVTQRDAVTEAVQDADIVFHLAATQHEMNVPDEKFWHVNVDGTQRMVDASAQAAVRRFVHGSTIGVYGWLPGTIDESSPCAPDNIYGTTKLEGEKRALSFRKALDVVVIRIPETYGPGDRRLLKLFRAINRGTFFLIGKGENVHHPIFVDDLIDGLLEAAASDDAVGEVLLLAGKDPVTTAGMVAAIAAALGRRPPRLRAPLAPFLAAATVLELTLRPLGVQPPLHRRRLDFFRKSFTLSAKKAERLLGFSPVVSFEEGARRTAAWYRETGLL
ncbi:MAG: NAD-dependent epimerase/dehydratase family protein [Gemmatimonadota bacterium]